VLRQHKLVEQESLFTLERKGEHWVKLPNIWFIMQEKEERKVIKLRCISKEPKILQELKT